MEALMLRIIGFLVLIGLIVVVLVLAGLLDAIF